MSNGLFFEKESFEDYLTVSGLTRITGLEDQSELLNLAVKELVDNALDASPIGTGIKIMIIDKGSGFSVRDYGDGIPGTDKEIADLFSITRLARTTKATRVPTRGALGRGLRYLAGFTYNFNGRIHVKTRGRILELQPTDKGTKVKKVTKVRKQINGTEVQVFFPERTIYVRETDLEWGKLTIELAMARESKASRKLSSPHWYDTPSFMILLNSVKDKTLTTGEVIANIFGAYSTDAFSPDVLAMLEKKASKKMDLKSCETLLHSMQNVYPKVEPDELGCVGLLENFILKEERKGYYELDIEGKNSEILKIPYVIELWARPLRGIEKSFFGYRHFNWEIRAKVFLFINKTFVPGNPIDIETGSYWVNVNKDFINFEDKVENLLKKHCIFYLNITTPYMQTAMDSKQPILPSQIIDTLKKMFLSIFNNVNNEKKFNKVRVVGSSKRERHSQTRQTEPESEEVIGIFNETTECIEDFLRNEGVDFDKGKLHKTEYLKVLNDDPFITGIEKPKIKKALWFKQWWSQFNPEKNRKHLRRFYYWVISQPNGTVKAHDGKDFKTKSPANAWDYVLESSKFARNLKLVDPSEIIDMRNPEPFGEIHKSLQFKKQISPASWTFPSGTLSIPETVFVSPQLSIDEEAAIETVAALQPVHLEIWTEKTTMNDILEPLCKEYGIRLVPYAGYASITSIDRFVEIAGSFPDKPSVIFYISDFDPAGENMPVVVSRYLQHRIWLLKTNNQWPENKEVFLHHVLLTKQQMESDEFKDLPRAPVGKKKKGEDDYSDTRPGAVELDALEALLPGRFKEIVIDHIAKVFDMEVAEKTKEEIRRIKEYFHSTIHSRLKPFEHSISEIKKKINRISKRYEKDLSILFKKMLNEIKPFVNEGISIEQKTNNFCEQLESELKPDIHIEKNPELEDCLFKSNRSFREQTSIFKRYRIFTNKKR